MMTTPAKNASNKSGCSAHTWGQDMAATLHILQQKDERAFELYNNFVKKKILSDFPRQLQVTLQNVTSTFLVTVWVWLKVFI